MNPKYAPHAARIVNGIRGRGWVPVVQLRRELDWGADHTRSPAMLTIINALKADGTVQDSRQWPSEGDQGKGYAIRIVGEVEA